jgi:hypothetical protein
MVACYREECYVIVLSKRERSVLHWLLDTEKFMGLFGAREREECLVMVAWYREECHVIVLSSGEKSVLQRATERSVSCDCYGQEREGCLA